TYKLVLPEELGEDPGLLSISSPIGIALVGQEEGSEVRVKIPAGVRRFEILVLKTIHDVA
ncbi:MAG TPA: GreA/GreB family elongation factor, partial [Holophagaceae bacterium]|nr:GreA/GreB family elongation factor [Holophagaceae bacterium]